MNKLTWSEMKDVMFKFNTEHHENETLTAVVAISNESFIKEYNLEARSYKFSSNNKAFKPNMLGRSIFASSLDGSDTGVRLDWYIDLSDDPWKVEYCYFV